MIASIAISLLAVAGFGVVLWRSRILTVGRDAMRETMAGLSAMMDSELDDDAKEIAVRRAGLRLVATSFRIFWRFGAALAAAAAPVFVADALDLVPSEAVFALMLRLDYIVAVSVLAIAVAEILRRARPGKAVEDPEANRYSAADRFFHVMAFASPAVLKAASWLEDRLVRTPIPDPSAPPIFVTSLARGGTTALLNALSAVPGIATHTYRDMPFLTAPTLWNRLAGGKTRGVERRQRAHGDGLEIDLDSPEAFEEVVWKMFWPEKYRKGSIAPWRADDRKPEAERFLGRHMRKILRARLPAGTAARYCSKNNANIARIPYLVESFPGCRIVVPVRRPESHAASLLRQHRNFLKLQTEDEFIRRYMRDIGHFEFGLIHKPIGFEGFDARRFDPATGDYWLNYWIHAFREILKHRDHCIFVLQDDLRAAPQDTMTALCGALDLGPDDLRFEPYFRSAPDLSQTDQYDRQLHQEASALYREFEALVRPEDAHRAPAPRKTVATGR